MVLGKNELVSSALGSAITWDEPPTMKPSKKQAALATPGNHVIQPVREISDDSIDCKRMCRIPLITVAVCLVLIAIVHLRPYAMALIRGDTAPLESMKIWTGDLALLADKADYVKSNWNVLSLLFRDIRINFISPILQVLVGFSAFLSALVAADRLFHFYLALFWQKISDRQPEDDYKNEELPPLDGSAGPVYLCEQEYPYVVVQIPMFNERDVCEEVIDHVCQFIWPKNRMLIQVLDDSTDAETRKRVTGRVTDWKEKGINIMENWRENREGYKAGALLEGEKYIPPEYEYTAIFDADFRPEPDFLLRTIPFLKHNPSVGFVQSRWVYSNPDDSMLTKIQEISLNYHIKCEQYARFASGNFFNFNGTAGVWRLKTIQDAGGWNNRTLVEDMDLSLRAFLRGWNFIFLNDVTCINELPATYAAYRKQQHRWSCGPMQLWRKAMTQVWQSNIPFVQKLYLNLFFFGTRLFATHIVSFVFYCGLVPITVVTPEVSIPFWALVYVPIMVTLSTVVFTPKSWYHCAHYVLFENAMSVVKLGAMLSGILELKDSHQWVVTLKHGKQKKQIQKKKSDQVLYRRELSMALFVSLAALYGIFVANRWEYSVFLVLQAITFTIFGLNMVDGH